MSEENDGNGSISLENLLDEIVAFRDERDWEQFHTPKELAAALTIEAAELQNYFSGWTLKMYKPL